MLRHDVLEKNISDYKERLKPLVNTRFERKLLDASFDNLLSKENGLKFNSFANGIRELSRHVLSRIAPSNEIEKCSWYQNETKKVGQVSRGERIKYAIQAGIPDNFITKHIDIKPYKQEILDAIELLNKFVHVNPETFNLSEKEVKENVEQVIEAFTIFIEVIKESNELIKSELESEIDQAIIDISIRESISEIDILSSHYFVDYVTIDEFHITALESRSLTIEVVGSLNITQQFGSNSDLKRGDGFEWGTSFPFSSTLTLSISTNFPKGEVLNESFKVDTSDWYE